MYSSRTTFMGDTNPDLGTINSVRKSFRIIEKLQKSGGCGVDDVSKSLNIPKSTVYKHLKTLENANYVRKKNSDYLLGYKFLKHGGYVRDHCRIFLYGRQKLEELGKKTDELVFMTILDHNQGAFIFHSNDQYNIRKNLPLGERFELHQNASGKAMLAEMSNEKIISIVEDRGMSSATEATITTQSDLTEEIDKIRTQQYALNRGERDSALWAVSSAVVDGPNNEIGAIGISIPADSPAREHIDEKYAKAVRRVSSKLTQQLRYN